MSSEDPTPSAVAALRPDDATPPGARAPGRVLPGRVRSTLLFARGDLQALGGSWLCRGFLLASGLLTVLELKDMQAEQKVASQMLEAVYATYLLVWMHGVIFIAGGALTREMDCLNDAILSRGVTRGEYISGKLLARCLAVLLLLGGVLLPTSLWAIRQDKLVRTTEGVVSSAARSTKVEAWDPRPVFAQVTSTVRELDLHVGDTVHAGQVLAQLDDRTLFDDLETDRRAEENARNAVTDAQRHADDARRGLAQAEDALERAERGLIGKDLLSRLDQADRQTDIRSRKRDLQTAAGQVRVAEDAIPTAARAVETAQAQVREARRRLAQTTVTAPISGYVTEVQAHPAQAVSPGTQLCTVAPLDAYQVRVPIYKFEEFKRLKTNLTAYVRFEHTEFKGRIERLGAMTQPDRWGRDANYVVVRFEGDGTPGLLGLPADVRLILPPPPTRVSRVTAVLNLLTGQNAEDAVSRRASVTFGWMAIALGKVLGAGCLLVTLTVALLVLLRHTLTAILGAIGLWHVSNLLFEFVGLKDLSYLEMVGTLSKVLGGTAKPADELTLLAWLFGLAAGFAVLAISLFVARDPPR